MSILRKDSTSKWLKLGEQVTAYTHKIEEDRVRSATLQKFQAGSVSEIKSHHFDGAIRYLVDLKPNELVN